MKNNYETSEYPSITKFYICRQKTYFLVNKVPENTREKKPSQTPFQSRWTLFCNLVLNPDLVSCPIHQFVVDERFRITIKVISKSGCNMMLQKCNFIKFDGKIHYVTYSEEETYEGKSS